MKVSKEVHVKFQAECVGNVYMLQNLKVIVSELQLSSASEAVVVQQSEITMNSSSDVQLYPKERLGLGANKVVQIITPMVEQVFINPLCIKEIVE